MILKDKMGNEIMVDDQDVKLFSGGTPSTRKERGYRYAFVHNIRLHRIIMNVTDPKIFVDHINGNTLDNRRCNLRLCSHKENSRNQKLRKNNTSSYKGVFYNKKNNNYNAFCTVNGKREFIGCFKYAYNAALAYNNKAIELHGEFARLNEITFEDKVKMFMRGEISEFPEKP